MAKFKKQMRVDYYASSDLMTTEVASFKYLLTAEPGSTSAKIRVTIMNLSPPDRLEAVKSGSNEIVTEDIEKAFLGTVARLNSHHDQLRCQMSVIEDSKQ